MGNQRARRFKNNLRIERDNAALYAQLAGVKGAVLKLSAIALSVKPGGSARQIDIEGGVAMHGDGVAPLEMLGVVGQLSIEGGISAKQGH